MVDERVVDPRISRSRQSGIWQRGIEIVISAQPSAPPAVSL
jgi:hypothetical protein